jgi:phosphinothricin acetyltransferase
MDEVAIRLARATDVQPLADIFDYYVASGHVTFDTEPMPLASRMEWFTGYGTGRYRLLVAEAQGRLLGCAYSSRYRQHSAFDKTVETSIYLDPAERGRGTGSRLYATLIQHLETQDIHLAVAGVALPNDGSLALHRKLAFVEVGTFKDYAIKNGKFISSVWFQRRIHR